MPEKERHFDLIDRNYGALNHLTSPNASSYIDWCTNIIFYMALHYIHAYLADKKNEHPSAHANLDIIMSNDKNLKPIYTKYRQIKDDSEDARYGGNVLSIYDLRKTVLKFYSQIEDKILQLLGINNRRQYNLHDLFPLN